MSVGRAGAAGVAALLCALVLPARAAPPVKVAVLELRALGVEPALAEALEEVFASALADSGCRVISRAEIASLVGFEATRQRLGCDDASCMAELGGALGADRLALGSVARVGDTWSLSLKLVDARTAAVDGRLVETAEGTADALLPLVREGARRMASGRLGNAPCVTGGAAAPGAGADIGAAAALAPSGRPRRGPWAWVALGAAAAAAAAGTWWGASALSAAGDWRSAPDRAAWLDARERTGSAARLATAAWAGAGVLAAGGIGLYYFTRF